MIQNRGPTRLRVGKGDRPPELMRGACVALERQNRLACVALERPTGIARRNQNPRVGERIRALRKAGNPARLWAVAIGDSRPESGSTMTTIPMTTMP